MFIKLCLVIGGSAGCGGVALGALVAHAFKTRLEPAALTTLGTVSQYLLIHGLLLIVIGAWLRLQPDTLALRIAAGLIMAGVFCFCGGLSVSILGGLRAAGSVAPLGGTALMAGWLVLAWIGLVRS
ncbi:MAG: DUF423 domain-containing protein [Gammaproteobacteria bacterium]